MTDFLKINDIPNIKVKNIFDALLDISINDKITSNEDIINKYKRLNTILKIDQLPINIQIQIAICLTCVTSCSLCLEGSRRLFFLLWFIHNNITNSIMDDFLVRYIILSKSEQYKHDIDRNNIMNYLCISHHILYYVNFKIDKEKNLPIDIKSQSQVLDAVKKLQKYITYGSIIKTSSILFYLLNKKEIGDVHWINTCVNEATIIGKTQKYDVSIRFLPLVFSACISQSYDIDNNFPFLNLIFSITCSLMCCNHEYTNCKTSLKFSNFSHYDVVFMKKIDRFVRFSKYRSTYKLILSLINDCQYFDDINFNDVLNQYNSTMNMILEQHKTIDIQLKRKNRIFRLMVKEDVEKEPEIPSLSIFFDNVNIQYKNLINNQIVYYNIRFNESSEIEKHHFFAELSLDIDHNIKRGDTVLIYGPLSMSHLPMRTIITRNQMKDDGVLALNYYINNLKMKYDFLNIDYIPFFNFLNIDLSNFVDIHQCNKEMTTRDPRKLDRLMSLDENKFHLFDYFSRNQDIGNKFWLVMNDPFHDYRLHPWSLNHMSNLNNSYVYHCINKNDKFVFRNGKLIDFETISFFKDYISTRSNISSVFMKKFYFMCIFKALFGIDSHNSLIDFFIHIDDKSQQIDFSIMPHIKFSSPRYAPYNFRKRNVLPPHYDPKNKKNKYLMTKFVKDIRNDIRTQQKTFFFDNFTKKTMLVIQDLYKFISDKEKKAWKTAIPGDIRKNINALYKYNTRNEEHSQFEFSMIDPHNLDYKAVFGCMTYFVSKLLGLDPNIYGFDPYFAYYIELGRNQKTLKPSMKILKKWVRSIAQNTSVLIENELNDNCIHYGKNKKSQVVYLTIHHFKGWFCDKDNVKTIAPTIEKWLLNLRNEEKFLDYVTNNQSQRLYNYLYNPDPKWLKTHWLPEVINAHIQTIRTFEAVANNGDMWNFCEFLFGRDFILNYLSYINNCLSMFIKRHENVTDFNIKLKTRNS